MKWDPETQAWIDDDGNEVSRYRESDLPRVVDAPNWEASRNGRFAPGNPGKPKGAKDRRRRRRPNVTLDILEDFHRHHGPFLAALREKDPAGYLRLLENHLLPKSLW